MEKGKSSPIFSRVFAGLKSSPRSSPKTSPMGSPKIGGIKPSGLATDKDTAALIDEEELEY